MPIQVLHNFTSIYQYIISLILEDWSLRKTKTGPKKKKGLGIKFQTYHHEQSFGRYLALLMIWNPDFTTLCITCKSPLLGLSSSASVILFSISCFSSVFLKLLRNTESRKLFRWSFSWSKFFIRLWVWEWVLGFASAGNTKFLERCLRSSADSFSWFSAEQIRVFSFSLNPAWTCWSISVKPSNVIELQDQWTIRLPKLNYRRVS